MKRENIEDAVVFIILFLAAILIFKAYNLL